MDTREDKLIALLHLAVTFMRKLRIIYKGREVRELPAEHPLFSYFERVKPIVKQARKAEVKQRPALVGELYEVVKEFWAKAKDRRGKKGQPGEHSDVPVMTLRDALERAEQNLESVLLPLTSWNAKEMNAQPGMERVKKEMEKIKKGMARDQRMKGTGGEIGDLVDGQPYELKEEKGLAPGPAAVDDSIVASVRREIRPILFERGYKRRAASVTGTRFSPSHFHEIKTRPEAPRIRKDVVRMGRMINETEMVLTFDRSGSMSGKKEEVTVQIAATLYKALSAIPRMHVQIIGFNDVPSPIKGISPVSMDTVLRRIPLALKSDGGTNLPLALKESIRLAEEGMAHKKVVIILTDGDTHGNPDPKELVEYAKKRRIDSLVIGVQGSDPYELKAIFGKKNTMYVEKIERLPEELRRIVVRRAIGQ